VAKTGLKGIADRAVTGVKNFEKGKQTFMQGKAEFMDSPTGKTLQAMSSGSEGSPPAPQPLEIPNLYGGPSGQPSASIGEENPQRRRRSELLRGL
jgi:hypothetical protein